MPCVGRPCSSARIRWRAAACAMRSFAPARFRAVVASSSSDCAFFFIARIVLMGKMIQLTASDGHKFDAYRADPSGKPRGAIVVIQEIFGVNSHIKNVADGYAADGYVAIAPAMFDRVQKGFDVGYKPDDIAKGREVRAKVTTDMAMTDTQAAVDEAKKSGKVGIVGYCWGGFVAWIASAKVNGLVAAVPYYRCRTLHNTDIQPKVPVMGHVADKDAHNPVDG